MEQVLYPLPEGWHLETIGEVAAKLVTGKTPSTKKTEYYSSSEVDWFTPSDFGSTAVLNNSRRKLSSLAVEDGTIKQMPKGSILLVAIGATIGKVGLAVDESCFNQQVTGIFFKEKIYPKYAYYWLSYIKPEIVAKSSQATLPIINQTGIKGLSFLYPEKEEQKHIVEKLDALLTRIDTAIEHLQESVTLADALVKSSLSSMLTKQEQWDKVSLSDVCQITSKLCDPREERYLDMFHIGGANITSFSGELINLKTARDEKLISGKFPFDNSMVLYSKIRPYLMKVARPMISGICSADIYPLTPDKQRMTRDFLFYLLLSEQFTQYAIEGSSRAGMPKVNRNHLFNFEFHLPSLDEQRSICKSLDSLVEKTNEVSRVLASKLSFLTGLKASILDSAFKGEL